MSNEARTMAACGLLRLAGGCTGKTDGAEAAPTDSRPLVNVGAVDPAHRFREARRVQA